MNTLSKQITARFFQAEAGFAELRARWSALVAADRRLAQKQRAARKQNSGIAPSEVGEKRLGAPHHLLYAILRGKDWRQGFAPCANPRRLANGYRRWAAATRALEALHNTAYAGRLLAPFGDLLAQDALALIRALTPTGEGYDWEADLDTMSAYVGCDQAWEEAAMPET